MNGIPAKLQKRIDEGYDFRFGDYIGRGFSLMQKEIGLFILGFILFLVLSGIASIVPILGGLISAVVVTPMIIVGFYYTGHKVDRGEKLEVADFFKSFDRIGDLILTALLVFLVVFGALLPGLILAISSGVMAYVVDGDLSSINTTLVFSGILLAAIPAIYFGVSYTWAYPLVWFYDLRPWQAMETSRKLIGKQWGIIFLFLLVVGILAGLGLVVLIVGILFTAPAMYLAQYAAFADVTGLLEDGVEGEEAADIIDHFVPAE
ncbi:MAG: hypothetical protein SFV52_09965 [Saprospiraceae bacterium]|nr:hypothetical protein [Saprospiraceae bacterium]